MKKILLLIIVIWLIGLLLFINEIPSTFKQSDYKTDAIVVLTGGKGRITEGVRLLKNNNASKLLISGVGQKANIEALKTMTDEMSLINNKLLEDRITLGHFATNTKQNAEEALNWMKDSKFNSLLLVTSNYHMQRSFLEFKYIMPDFEIIPYPVFSSNFKVKEWWKLPGTFKLIISEYNKFITIYIIQLMKLR
jgi:uncharacterized SAM-binding protein YcdF (DUF218 family)